MSTPTKPMTKGEMRARVRLSLRCNSEGFPLWWLRKQAKENGHDAAKLIAAMRKTGSIEVRFNEQARMRWVYPGPSLSH